MMDLVLQERLIAKVSRIPLAANPPTKLYPYFGVVRMPVKSEGAQGR